MFSISKLSQFSGIKAHTIRMWEQRYNALNPGRSEGNTRYYDNIQLRRLLNIVSLMDSEYKVSELCTMSDEKLSELTGNLTPELKTDERNEYFIAQLLTASITYDEAHFEKVFSQCLLKQGLKETYNQVIYPLLNRIGLMWTKDTIVPAQEHFISNLIRQKLFSALDSLPPAKTDAETWLLFLPENEHHDMGLLFANYLIRSAGKKVFYLGDNVPFSSLESAVKDTKAQNMLLLLVHYDFVKDTQDYIDQLSHNFSSKNIFIAGNQKLISKLSLGSKLHWLKSIEELNTLLLP